MPSVSNYGIRFHTVSLSIGSSMSFFLPTEDMPDERSPRGYEVFQDVTTTPTGNSFLYGFGRIKTWEMSFLDISTDTKEKLEHICHGWIGSQQITILAFGTSVIGTTETMASMASAGQIYGTGFCQQLDQPIETALDLWNFRLLWTQFGPDQTFS